MTPVSYSAALGELMSAMSDTEVTMNTETVANAFVEARRDARALADYPGTVPETLEAAYRVQDAAIRLNGGTIAGWKVGRIQPPLDASHGTTRLAGPIFAGHVHAASPVRDMPVFVGGFGAIEAEFLFQLGAVDTGRTHWSAEDAARCVTGVHVGFEIASSPFRGINELGPTVTVSDFGNNHGLVIGPALSDWRPDILDAMTVTTLIDDVAVGTGTASSFPGGCMGSVAFLLEHLASRGIAIPAGTWVSTGAVSGVHDIAPGSTAVADFGGLHRISCRIVAATDRT